MIQQHIEGLPVAALTQSMSEPDLARWWQSYLDSYDSTLGDLPADRRAEVAMAIPIKNYRLTAHFDLIATESDNERAVIVDWKTEQRLPSREQLLNRMQTRVYRYVLTTAQQRLPGTVAMIYWFAQHPAQPVTLPYNAVQFAGDHTFLTQLIEEIEQRAADDGEWDKTPDERKCAYCVYRSLCQRGVKAGVVDPDEEDLEIEINLEEIDEIVY